MTSRLTPKQRLELDRARKRLYREALRQRGYTQRTIWSGPTAWAQLKEWAATAGLDLIIGKKTRTVRGRVTVRGAGGADDLGEEKAKPAYLSDKPAGEASS